MNLLCRGRLKLLVASLTAIVLLTWLYLLAGNLESEYHHANGRPRSPPQSHRVIFHPELLCNDRAALRFGATSRTQQRLCSSCSLRILECFLRSS